MSDTSGEEGLHEEPQSERGPMGSRDEGSDEPGGGPADRPAGQADDNDDTGIDDEEPVDPTSPDLPTGD